MAHQQDHPAKSTSSLRLSRLALAFVALAAIMGWGASFVGLHAYGMDQMVGFDYLSAWLIPATFDGAAFGATLITYRASIHGRSAMRGRLLMWTFTGISSWINWIHQITPEARIVASGLPIAAVAVFDVVLAELRADYEERHGKRRLRVRPGLLLLRWLVDRRGTAEAFRKQVTDIPVSEIAGLGNVVASVPATADRVLEAGAERRAITASEPARPGLPRGTAESTAPEASEEDASVEPARQAAPVDRRAPTARTNGVPTTAAARKSSAPPKAETGAPAESSSAPERNGTPARQPVDVKQSIDEGSKHRSSDEEDVSMVQTVTIPALPEGPLCPWPSKETASSLENGQAGDSAGVLDSDDAGDVTADQDAEPAEAAAKG